MKRNLFIALFVLLVVAGAIASWRMMVHHTRTPVAASSTPPKHNDSSQAASTANAPPPPKPRPKPKPKDFCARDFKNVPARKADVPQLATAGGLVHIFEEQARLNDPYGCAAFYLKQGLDVNAIDPRPDHGHLTGLLFAIKRNDPKMVHFMIDHGADLQERAGEKKIKPYGYAVFLALSDQRIDRNKVIDMLDHALTEQQAKAQPRDSGDHGQ